MNDKYYVLKGDTNHIVTLAEKVVEIKQKKVYNSTDDEVKQFPHLFEDVDLLLGDEHCATLKEDN